MSISPGTYQLGPENATLTVRTGRTGAVAKAGHDLLLEVTAWSGRLDAGEPANVELSADATSLKVREGTGGMQALDDGDVANIHTTIDDEVLKREAITFRSTRLTDTPEGFHVQGELTLLGRTRPLAFDVIVADGALSAVAVFRQTDFGMKPYSALFGALKVADQVTVALDAQLSI